MFEHYTKPLLPPKLFLVRVLRYLGFTIFLLVLSLGVGAVGYHYFNELSWLDAVLNASMILTGMGPVDPMKNASAKWFASGYAIFSGVAFLTIVSVFLSPLVHRFLHLHHLDETKK